MAGYYVGSLIVTWVLSSALNGVVEHAARRGKLNRSKAFIFMVLGVVAIVAAMVHLAVFGLPGSYIGRELLTPDELTRTINTSCVLNVLLAVGYCGLQLRRFVGD